MPGYNEYDLQLIMQIRPVDVVAIITTGVRF